MQSYVQPLIVYAGCVLAVSMELLAISSLLNWRWILISPLVAGMMTYLIEVLVSCSGDSLKMAGQRGEDLIS